MTAILQLSVAKQYKAIGFFNAALLLFIWSCPVQFPIQLIVHKSSYFISQVLFTPCLSKDVHLVTHWRVNNGCPAHIALVASTLHPFILPPCSDYTTPLPFKREKPNRNGIGETEAVPPVHDCAVHGAYAATVGKYFGTGSN